MAQYKDFKKSQESRPLLTTVLQAATFSYWDSPLCILHLMTWVSIQIFWIVGLVS